MDHSIDGHWHHLGQLSTQHRPSSAERDIRWCERANWYGNLAKTTVRIPLTLRATAVGLLVMMYPILCKVRFETLHLLLKTKELWRQIAISFVLNWIIAPLFMVALAWAFLPDKQELRDGLIFVGVARCIAMVLIWTDLAGGDGDYCAVLVAFNSLLQIVLFAPMAVFYVRVGPSTLFILFMY